ncbi:cell division protein ZapA [Blastomonas aquatica]|uniref:Cell division protein ZapA n=1 Tax=Blastomonas aquatica TaxID=1510276 RepID=A0ABQ1JEP0_9SPHN|nr:cell division protein ZapA [Blastomonas aquatica]GGB66614.1 cell division protein ZapA [Blastomonas aquatica]
MPDMRLSIAGRIYNVTCQPGEEQHLARLGAMLDAAGRKAGASGGLTETRALLFAGLLLADELAEAQDREAEILATNEAPPEPIEGQGDWLGQDEAIDQAALAIEQLAHRIENLAEGLEKRANQS